MQIKNCRQLAGLSWWVAETKVGADMNRRQMLATMGLFAAGGTLFADPPTAGTKLKSGIRIFAVTDFGAKGDGTTLDTSAINRTIDACHGAGGGAAYMPPGLYLS